MPKKRILSGMRPTGRLHLGHYAGALENWVNLQDEYQNYHLIADYHVLTTRLETENITNDTYEMLIDWLAAGLDPEKSPMFRQSQIKEHTELFLIFSMLITANRLERNPTLKDQVRDLNIQQVIYGHLGYPVLQAADILLYKGQFVPVGEDQVPHIEITREIAKRFNKQYCTKDDKVLPVPKPLLTKVPRLVGLDGKAKMSKSLNNTILMSDGEEEIKAKLKKAVTDPQKVRKGDPGRPEVCPVFSYHQYFNQDEIPEIERGCRSGELGCFDCKMNCASKIYAFSEPILEKRRYYKEHMEEVRDILADGEQKAQRTAADTMKEVREAMKLG